MRMPNELRGRRAMEDRARPHGGREPRARRGKSVALLAVVLIILGTLAKRAQGFTLIFRAPPPANQPPPAPPPLPPPAPTTPYYIAPSELAWTAAGETVVLDGTTYSQHSATVSADKKVIALSQHQCSAAYARVALGRIAGDVELSFSSVRTKSQSYEEQFYILPLLDGAPIANSSVTACSSGCGVSVD